MPLTLGTWFSQEHVFLPGYLVLGFIGLIKGMDVAWTFLVREYTRVVFAIWVSLVSLLPHFPEELCLSPDLSSWNVGMQKQTFCFSSTALHLLQNCLNLASMPYIGEVGEACCWSSLDFGYFQKNFLMKFPIVWTCCIPRLPVCSDIQPTWKVFCSNCDLMR